MLGTESSSPSRIRTPCLRQGVRIPVPTRRFGYSIRGEEWRSGFHIWRGPPEKHYVGSDPTGWHRCRRAFGSAMRFRNWSARNAPVLIRDVTIRNVNFGVATGNINRCGVWQDSSDSMEVIEPKGNFEVDGLTVFDDNQQLIRPVWTMGIAAAPTIAKVRNVYVNRHGYPAVLPLRTKVQGGVGWSELPMVSLSSSSAIAGTDYVGQMVELTGSGGFRLPEAALTSGCVFRIRNGSSGSINVTALAGGITGSTYGSYTNTGSSLTLINGQYAELWSNGSTWVLK